MNHDAPDIPDLAAALRHIEECLDEVGEGLTQLTADIRAATEDHDGVQHQ